LSLFKKATKEANKLKIGIEGPSGSGKTYSALRLATGFGGEIACIDTENKSASLYSDTFNFDTASMSPPYLYTKYIKAIEDAVDAKYTTIIIDSVSHGWLQLLEDKNISDERTKANSFTSWGRYTPKQNEFLKAILHSDIHIICCSRTKQDYVMGENHKGKMAPSKVGLATVQREGFEYELTLNFRLAMDNKAQASKNRTNLFVGETFQITEKTGQSLREWLTLGVPTVVDNLISGDSDEL